MKKILKFRHSPISLRSRILKEASGLFSESGFLGVSMSDIAGQLGITKAAIYYHFNSKKELYLEVLKRSSERLIQGLREEISDGHRPRQTIFRLIRGYLDFGLKEKSLIKCLALRTSRIDPEISDYVIRLREGINRQLRSFIRVAARGNRAIQRNNKKSTASLLLGMMDGTILESSLSNKKFDTKKRSSQILKVIAPLLNIQN